MEDVENIISIFFIIKTIENGAHLVKQNQKKDGGGGRGGGLVKKLIFKSYVGKMRKSWCVRVCSPVVDCNLKNKSPSCWSSAAASSDS